MFPGRPLRLVAARTTSAALWEHLPQRVGCGCGLRWRHLLTAFPTDGECYRPRHGVLASFLCHCSHAVWVGAASTTRKPALLLSAQPRNAGYWPAAFPAFRQLLTAFITMPSRPAARALGRGKVDLAHCAFPAAWYDPRQHAKFDIAPGKQALCDLDRVSHANGRSVLADKGHLARRPRLLPHGTRNGGPDGEALRLGQLRFGAHGAGVAFAARWARAKSRRPMRATI